jgi:2-dehydropantoate 2-reductase
VRILVVGAGATGGYFGARLTQAGRDVTFLVRPGRAAALRERGLRIIGLGESTRIVPKLVTAPELRGTYDVVLLSVKATALDQALEDVAPAVGPETAIIPFLNGIAHLDTLNARFGKEPVLGGVVKIISTIDENGDILRLAPLASLTFGDGPSARDLRALLDVAGFELSVSPDITAAMWHKWVFIVTLGALTCLMRGTVGDVAAVDGGSLGRTILAEAAAVSTAAGFPLPDKEYAATEAMATKPGSPVTSSMYRDVVAGRPTEVEHVFGDLVSRARTLGVETPLLDLATLHLRVHERRITPG